MKTQKDCSHEFMVSEWGYYWDDLSFSEKPLTSLSIASCCPGEGLKGETNLNFMFSL